MNPDSGLILPALVPATNELILSPQAKIDRAAMLAAIEAEEAEHDDISDDELRAPAELRDRVKIGVCHTCSKTKLLFKPAMVCEACLTQLAREHGLDMPAPAAGRSMNRAERRRRNRG